MWGLASVHALSKPVASIALIEPSSSRHTPQISDESGFAHAFCSQFGHVYFVLLAAFFWRSRSSARDCQRSSNLVAFNRAKACAYTQSWSSVITHQPDVTPATALSMALCQRLSLVLAFAAS